MDGTTSATFSNNIDDLIADLQKEFELVSLERNGSKSR